MSSPSPERNQRGAVRDESGQSGAERIEQRQQRPGQAGLANERRPGLGTRADEEKLPPTPGEKGQPPKKKTSTSTFQKKTGQNSAPHPDVSPPAREQLSDSMAQEQQRSTGMSGQSSGT